MNKNKINILICPLDWGLGHATRCIPIIKELVNRNINVVIAGSGASLHLLKCEFPQLEYIPLEGYNISYPKNGNMVFKMFSQFPALIYKIFKEHKQLKHIIKNYNIDAVISDNRYGLYTKRIPSIFITHQLIVKCPYWLKFLEPFIFLLNYYFISRYSECWVPDYKGKINLSGDLSHKYPRLSKIRFIGPQSRLYNTSLEFTSGKEIFDLMVILSGPEPQRSIMENIVISQLTKINLKSIVVLGNPGFYEEKQIGTNITLFSCLTSDDIIKYMGKSNIVLCRSGYSSIMDLCALGKKAILVPTPGQTEQEYLASYFKKRKIFYSQSQKELNIFDAIMKSENYDGIKIKNNPSLLNIRLHKLLQRIVKK